MAADFSRLAIRVAPAAIDAFFTTAAVSAYAAFGAARPFAMTQVTTKRIFFTSWLARAKDAKLAGAAITVLAAFAAYWSAMFSGSQRKARATNKTLGLAAVDAPAAVANAAFPFFLALGVAAALFGAIQPRFFIAAAELRVTLAMALEVVAKRTAIALAVPATAIRGDASAFATAVTFFAATFAADKMARAHNFRGFDVSRPGILRS